MIHKILSLICLITVVLQPYHSKEVKRNMHDETIVAVLSSLNCPFLLSQLTPEKLADYAAIDTTGLTMVNRWDVETGSVELFQGSSGDFLAILVNDNKVKCAQYINNYALPEDNFQADSLPNIYYHEAKYSGDGFYLKVERAFFIDGKATEFIYFSPNSHEGIINPVSDSESILSLLHVDACDIII